MQTLPKILSQNLNKLIEYFFDHLSHYVQKFCGGLRKQFNSNFLPNVCVFWSVNWVPFPICTSMPPSSILNNKEESLTTSKKVLFSFSMFGMFFTPHCIPDKFWHALAFPWVFGVNSSHLVPMFIFYLSHCIEIICLKDSVLYQTVCILRVICFDLSSIQ